MSKFWRFQEDAAWEKQMPDEAFLVITDDTFKDTMFFVGDTAKEDAIRYARGRALLDNCQYMVVRYSGMTRHYTANGSGDEWHHEGSQ